MNILQQVIILLAFYNLAEVSHQLSNGKNCTWANINNFNMKVISRSYTCPFHKKSGNTYLKVSFTGNVNIWCNKCCTRWYFTFNGEQCSTPAKIGAIINVHQTKTQQGYCGGIGKGLVKVGMSVGKCAGSGDSNYTTGYRKTSRMSIEEVIKPPQE